MRKRAEIQSKGERREGWVPWDEQWATREVKGTTGSGQNNRAIWAFTHSLEAVRVVSEARWRGTAQEA